MSSLWPEMTAALAAVTPQQDAHLARLGVPPAGQAICGVVVAACDRVTFWPDPGGSPLVVVPCWHDNEVVDLVGFNTTEPGRWWQRTGHADYLGSAVEYQWHDELIDVFRSPLSWLKAGAPADGMVILNPNPPRLDFAGVELVAEDEDHAREILEMLTIPARAEWRPTVRLPIRAAA